MIDIYNFIDYRAFLREYFEEQKKLNQNVTHRFILNEMGVSSTGFIANVVSGKKNLTIDQAKKISKIFSFSPNKTNYFKYMVYFNKAKTLDEKNDFFETLDNLRRKRRATLDDQQISLFSKWYYVVIREILSFIQFKDDYSQLANMLVPPIKMKEAKQAVEVLLRLKLIKRDAKGFLIRSDNVLSTEDEIQSYYVANFNRKMTDLAKRALEKIPAQQRDLSGMTLALSEKGYSILKTEIRELRKRAIKLASEDREPQKVFRVGLALFPISKPKEAQPELG